MSQGLGFTDAGGQIIWEVYLVRSYLAKIGQHFRLGMLLYLTYPDVEAGHHHLSSGCDDRDVLTDDPLLHIHHLACREKAWKDRCTAFLLLSCALLLIPTSYLNNRPLGSQTVWCGLDSMGKQRSSNRLITPQSSSMPQVATF